MASAAPLLLMSALSHFRGVVTLSSGLLLTIILYFAHSPLSSSILSPSRSRGSRSDLLDDVLNSTLGVSRIVEQNISSALVLEDDVDWDIRIKSQMRNFAKASRLLVQPLPGGTGNEFLDPTYLPQAEKESREVKNFHVGVDSTSEPTTSPYGDLDRWDLLWLGHCGTIFPGNDDKDIPLGRAVISDDETVPERQHIGIQFGDTDRFRNEYPDHTRVVSRARYSTCVLGYAMSQQGARRLLYELGLHKTSGPFDLALRQLCDGDGRDRMTCLAVQPELFNHHRPVGHKSGFSDISDHPDEYNSVVFSRNIRWATKVNLPKLVKGDTNYIDLYKDGDEGPPSALLSSPGQLAALRAHLGLMADQKKGDNPLGQYKYAAMSNLVLQHDKRFVTRRGDEETGDPESLAGRISLNEMGSRTAREAAPARPTQEIARKRKRTEPLQSSRAAGILSQADLNIEGLRYRPRTATSKDIYDLIATNVAQKMGGDYGLAVTASATDSILEYLKDESLKDFDRKKEIDDILGEKLSSKEFNQLVNLGKKILDYDAQDEDDEMENGDEGAELDEQQGVAVDFGDEEEDEGGSKQTYEVKDDGEDSEDEMAIGEEKDDENESDPVDDAVAADGNDDDDENPSLVIENRRQQRAEEQGPAFVAAHEIDAYWLQRQISQVYPDVHVASEKTREAEQIMSAVDEAGDDKPLREVENDLMELFDYESPELVGQFVKNRDKIVWVGKWRRAAEDSDALLAVEKEMVNAGHADILKEIRGRDLAAKEDGPRLTMKLDPMQLDAKMPQDEEKKEGLVGGLQPRKTLNLDDLKFDQGNHLMTNQNVKLPQGSTKKTFKGYEEIHVPAPKRKVDPNEQPLMPTSHLPAWAQSGFGNSKSLNRIQTSCFPSAFEDDGNMLICAPTGSGKTNVAMLTMLREIGKHRNPQTGDIDLDSFKIIYIAPLKALVQEQVGNFGKRLEPYGIQVAELTGDRQLTKQQIAETQVIVTTPEKWDVITRKATDTSYTNLVRLICIDEIHLLHDDRGPVLESIVSRTIRRTERTGDPVRIVGLSATLPNYRDVASFLRVDPQKDLFHFDGSFRPCPLKQEFIGVTDKKAIKQLKTMNDVCYTKVLEQVGQNKQQMLIFVHSRKETAKTARYIRDKALEEETIEQTEQLSKTCLQMALFKCLSALLPLLGESICLRTRSSSKAHRSTLLRKAPGSNSVLRMFCRCCGRAGRPQYDTYGEGIIITTQGELQYYLSLLNQQLPIESQLVSRLADNLNAEVVLGNIRTRDEGVEWLGYTYLFIRMLRSPALYQVGADYDEDEALEQKRVDLIHSAATVLEKASLVKYDKKNGRILSTDLGRVASHYYITHSSMLTYNTHITPSVSPIELFRVFALSDEFKYIPVRQDEKLELAKLLQRVPIPVKETIDEPHCKINVLLQAYVSRLKLEGLALMADLVYVTQSAGRILRAMFEIALKKGWAGVAKDALNLCKMAEKRMWPTMSPMRQFPECSVDIIKKAERMDIPWSSYFDLDPPRMGELLGMPRQGRQVCAMVGKFPRLEVEARMQPMTRSTLRIELTLTPNFEWDDSLHGRAESFWILVEDCDGEEILFHDQFLLRKDYAVSENNQHVIDFTVPITEPMPPNYFITVVSDRWMHAETRLALSFQKLVLPEKFPPHTRLLDLQPLPVAALKNEEYIGLYPDWEKFNRIQTQTFNSLYQSSDNVFVGSPTGSGKTVCAEFALLQLWTNKDCGKAVYIAPYQEQIDVQCKAWQSRLSRLAGGKTIVKLIGETTADLKLLDQGDLILATPAQWDMMCRQWQRRKNVQAVKLIIADDLHLLGGHEGYVYETVISRSQAIAANLDGLRIVGLSVSLANAKDIGEWMGATKHTIYNFSPHVRPISLNLHLQGYNIPHFPSLMLAMTKPTLQAVLQYAAEKPAIVFVPSRKQVRATARDILAACAAEDDEDRFLKTDIEQLQPVIERVKEKTLAESLSHGVGYYHEALSSSDKRIVEVLFAQGAIQVMLVSRDCCWELTSTAHLVVIMGTQYFDGREHRYIDYPISEILQMFGKAGTPMQDKDCRGVLMCPEVKRTYYKKFLSEALPVESQLQSYMPDAFVTEISTKTIESTQDAVDWTTYTYFYRRLLANPSYYNLTDTSHEGLSAFLSELVESTLKDLADANIIEIDEDEDTVTPLNAAMIAAYYNLSFYTIQTLLMSLKRTTKLKGILEIVTAASEFEHIQIRRHEESILQRIYDRCPVKLSEVDFESPHFKAFVLLQAHFSRMQLPTDLAKDQEVILRKILNLLSATVDVLSSEGHLNAMSAMEISQMVVQAMWDRDSSLKQIPYFGDETVEVCNQNGIKDVFEFMDAMDPAENPNYDALVKGMALSNQQLAEAARFTNDRYPNVDLNFELEDPESVVSNAPSYINVTVERQLDEDEEPSPEVHAPFHPVETKSENWWLVVGEESSKTLLAIKRVQIQRVLKTRLEVVIPTSGKKELTLFLMSDSYVGVDQAPTFEVDVGEGAEESEDEDEDGMEQ
nr:dexh-box atp-dependent rna helicase dexh13 [Quercus suber]